MKNRENAKSCSVTLKKEFCLQVSAACDYVKYKLLILQNCHLVI